MKACIVQGFGWVMCDRYNNNFVPAKMEKIFKKSED